MENLNIPGHEELQLIYPHIRGYDELVLKWIEDYYYNKISTNEVVDGDVESDEIEETSYLLKSFKNAARLAKALQDLEEKKIKKRDLVEL